MSARARGSACAFRAAEIIGLGRAAQRRTALIAILRMRLRRTLGGGHARHGAARRKPAIRRRDTLADQSLDRTQERAFLAIAKGDGNAGSSRPRGAADPMHIGFRDIRQIEIDDMRDAIDIDAARRDVSCDEHFHAAVTKSGQGLFALSLALIAMDGARRNAIGFQMIDHMISAMFRARENQSPAGRRLPQKIDEHLPLARCLDEDHLLVDGFHRRARWRDRDFGRLMQKLTGKLADGARHGRREEEALTLLRQNLGDPPDGMDETHVEHLIGFVEHQDFDFVETQSALIEMVDETARRCNENIDASADTLSLGPERDTAEHRRDGKVLMTPIGAEAIGDLTCEFACRRQNQRAAGLGVRLAPGIGQPVQDWKGESRRLSSACLREAEDIAARERIRNGLCLDRSRHGVILFRQRTKDRRREIQVSEIGQESSFKSVKTADARTSQFSRDSGSVQAASVYAFRTQIGHLEPQHPCAVED